MLNPLHTTKFDRFQDFVERTCESCQNSQEDCDDFKRKHPICDWADDFNDAQELCKKLDETETYFEHLAKITPEDQYDFDAEEKTIGELEQKLQDIQNEITCCNKVNQFEYHKYFGYEI